MPDMTAISGLASSLKATSDLAKAMLGIRDAQLVREKAVELTAEIITAQQCALATQAAQAELIDREASLKDQIAKLEDWRRDKERYELKAVATGVFAYAIKPGMEAGEPSHYICANCYNRAQKSFLQQETRNPGRIVALVCHGCGHDLIIAGSRGGPEPYLASRSKVGR